MLFTTCLSRLSDPVKPLRWETSCCETRRFGFHREVINSARGRGLLELNQ